MKISHRLIALSTVSALALMAVGAVGLYGVRTIQQQFDALTSRTTPLKNALLEQQGRKERAIGSLIELSFTRSESEVGSAREAVIDRLAALDTGSEHVLALDPSYSTGSQSFHDAFDGISALVANRLAGIAGFNEAVETARREFVEVDQRIAQVSAGIAGIADEATAAAATAQRESDRLVTLQRQAQTASGLLADMTVLLYATDALSSKFRVGPLQERFIASIETLERLLAGGGADSRLRTTLPDPATLRAAFAGESEGLFTLRLAVLDDVSGASRTYRNARKAVAVLLGDSRTSVAQLIDQLELDVLLERRAIETALNLNADPSSIIGVNQELSLGVRDLAVRLERLLPSTTLSRLDEARADILNTLDELITLAARLTAGLEAIERADLTKVADDVRLALEQTRESVALVHAGITQKIISEQAVSDELTALRGTMAAQRERGERAVAEISDTVLDASRSVAQQAETATLLIITLSSGAVLLSIVFSLITIRSIIARLKQALEVANAVSMGRLDPVETGRQRDEISQLMQALGRMVATLDGSVRKIRTATHGVNSDAEQISAGNGELSERTEQQASRLSETVGATGRINEIVRGGAEAAKQASDLSAVTSTVAGQGRQAVQNAMASMQSIESGAREISNITAVIDAISFQTNILALNAAVEASRAGESGRGFAVVAAEVGSLAMKSKDSVLKIKEIIDKNVQHVEAGSTLVSQAGQHMEEVVEKVDEVTRLIGEVADSSQRQVQEISQIDGSVGNLEQMTHQNATLSDRTTGAAMSLLEQSRALDESVSVFSLPDSRGGRRAA